MLIAKINDMCQGFCVVCETWMTGNIITGSGNVSTNKMPTSHLNSIVQGACGHTGSLICVTKNRVNTMPIGTMGAFFSGVFTGSVITGSSNVRSL